MRTWFSITFAISVLAIAGASLLFYGCGNGGDAADSSGPKASNNEDGSGTPPTPNPRPTYVGRASCVECHAEAVAKWEGSHHFHAMELPNDQTVRADFNGTTFTHHDISSRFFRKDGRYLIETENQKGKQETFPVKYTFGWEPLQQYLVEFPDGRLQVLPFCWDVEG
ncbi:MAG: hypothetical protein QF685_06655, partial [Verrucomicrobiota bacterium]|nr:hypothetical protein [Verrucomicrobiota bacterium]